VEPVPTPWGARGEPKKASFLFEQTRMGQIAPSRDRSGRYVEKKKSLKKLETTNRYKRKTGAARIRAALRASLNLRT